jgi:hypothetical protein
MIVTCPYCYIPQDVSALRYVCTGNAAAGRRPCEAATDDARQEFTGYALPSMPTFAPDGPLDAQGRARCPLCWALCGGQACARCHTPLPQDLRLGISPLIGMVGRKASGKSVYLTVLNQQLHEVVRKPFRADVQLVGDVQPGSNTVQEWLENNYRALYDKRRLLPATESSPNGRRVPLVVAFRYERKPRRGYWRRPQVQSVLMSFCDVAGEDLLNQPSAARQPYLTAANGLIVMLDAWHIPGVREELLPESDDEPLQPLARSLEIITETLRGARGPNVSGKLAVPVAVVVSKFDVLERTLPERDFLRTAEPRTGPGYDEQYGQNVHERLRGLLVRYRADEVENHLRLFYSTYRFFAVSSLGDAPVESNGRQRTSEGGPRPKNVPQPLLWLLHQQGLVDGLGDA